MKLKKMLPGACLVLLLAGSSAGCSKAQQLCDLRADCEGLSDSELDECITYDETIEDEAAIYDCSDTFDAYYDCMMDHNECIEGVFTTGQECTALAQEHWACMSG
ncbi:MAG: hypothetical protein ABIJ56_20500 [Pseudomonadota bacterium]